MKTMLVTGGGSGLGLSLAKVYVNEYKIILIGRKEEKLIDASHELKALGGEVDYFACDITNATALKNLRLELQMTYGHLDVLINNAGVGYFGPFEQVTTSHLSQMLDINVKGTILMTQTFIPIVKEQVINIISTAGLKGKVNEAVYVASKFAVRGFTESLQKEYENRLLVTAVYMGGMDTPFWQASDHIKDKSRLKSPDSIAGEIKKLNDGRLEIIV